MVLLVLTGLSLALLAYSIFNAGRSTPTPQSEEVTQKTDLKSSTNKNIKATFAQSGNKNIATYINLASSQENPDLAYQYYIRAYTEMDKEYAVAKDPKIKLSMIRLASYLSTLPQYKEGDVVIPK